MGAPRSAQAAASNPATDQDFFVRFLGRLESFPPNIVMAAFFFVGLLLMLGSFVLGLSSVVDMSTGKEYGYVYEINWGFNYVVLVPIAVYFCTAALNSIHQTIIKVADSRMIVTENGELLDRSSLNPSWQGYGRRAIQVWFVLVFLVGIAVGAEWWHSCIFPLHLTEAQLLAFKTEFPGWTLSPYFSHGQIHPFTTVAFGAFAFCAEGAVASVFLLFISVIFAFATWVFGYTNEDVPAELFPNPRSGDLRRGFECFQLFIENLLLATVGLCLVFFMTRIQSVFVDSDSKSVMSFIAGDIGRGFFQGLKELVKAGDTGLFATGKNLGYSIAMVGSATALSITTGFLTPSTIVRQAAMRAKDRLKDWAPHHEEAVQKLYGLSPQDAIGKLDEMVFWPILYPAPVQLLLFAVLAAGCFVFYKLTLVLVGVLLFSGVRQFLSAFSSKGRESG